MVCLDTHVIIWGIKEEASPGQENMVQRAKSYIRHQVNQGVDLMIPAPVVAEAVVKLTTCIRTIIESSFFIPAFDSPAALLKYQIFPNKKICNFHSSISTYVPVSIQPPILQPTPLKASPPVSRP